MPGRGNVLAARTVGPDGLARAASAASKAAVTSTLSWLTFWPNRGRSSGGRLPSAAQERSDLALAAQKAHLEFSQGGRIGGGAYLVQGALFQRLKVLGS